MMKTGLKWKSVCLALALGLVAIGCGADDTFGEVDSDGSNGSTTEGANNSEQSTNNENTGQQDSDNASGAPEEEREPGEEPGEEYEEWEENDFVDTSEEDTSTFSVDVDNASYTVMRRDVNEGRLPDPDSVRPEEYVNFFNYDYMQPQDDKPFSVNLEMAPSEFGEEDHQLLQIGLQGLEIPREDMKPNNLVFLIDASGSMGADNKLPLVKKSLHVLLDHLNPDDTIGIVTYSDTEKKVLDPTPVSDRDEIEDAIDGITATGSTNAEAGLHMAYDMAKDAKIEGGNNRVVVSSDGAFNVGTTDDELVEDIKEYRDDHISLTISGYGAFQDGQLEPLARKVNGNYFYVDNEEEAERIYGEDITSTLEMIASDVKIQVEFDEETVDEYRLVGYETRVMDNEDFDDDSKDAGEIGAGHSVTAMYELSPSDEAESSSNLLANLRLRYKEQFGDDSKLIEQGIKMSQARDAFDDASDDFRFAAAVTEYAEILRESKHSEGARFDDVESIADGASSEDDERRQEFVDLVDKAADLWDDAEE